MTKYQISERGFEVLDAKAGMPPERPVSPTILDYPETSGQLGSLFPAVQEEKIWLEPQSKLPKEDYAGLMLDILEYLAQETEGSVSSQKIGMDLKIPSEVLLPTLEVMVEENLIEKVKEVD